MMSRRDFVDLVAGPGSIQAAHDVLSSSCGIPKKGTVVEPPSKIAKQTE
jgi:hypothetical protein